MTTTLWEAQVPTAHGSRYLQQLCKHWQHKFAVSFDPQQGSIALPLGQCRLQAAPDSLRLTLEAPEAESMPRLAEIVANHLRRFAFREELAIDWQPREA